MECHPSSHHHVSSDYCWVPHCLEGFFISYFTISNYFNSLFWSNLMASFNKALTIDSLRGKTFGSGWLVGMVELARGLDCTCICLMALVRHYRRQILLTLKKDLREELLFVQEMIEDQPKNYQVW